MGQAIFQCLAGFMATCSTASGAKSSRAKGERRKRSAIAGSQAWKGSGKNPFERMFILSDQSSVVVKLTFVVRWLQAF